MDSTEPTVDQTRSEDLKAMEIQIQEIWATHRSGIYTVGDSSSHQIKALCEKCQAFIDEGKNLEYIRNQLSVQIKLPNSDYSFRINQKKVEVDVLNICWRAGLLSVGWRVKYVATENDMFTSEYLVVGAVQSEYDLEWILIVIPKITCIRWKNHVPHSLDSPAIEVREHKVYALEGYITANPRTLDIDDLVIYGADARSVILRYVSLENLIRRLIKRRGITIVDYDENSSLCAIRSFRWNMEFLLAKCGTGREVLLLVPPTIKNVEEAQAWVQSNKTWVKPEVRT